MVKGKIVCLDHDAETVTVYVKDYQYGDHCAARCEAPKVGGIVSRIGTVRLSELTRQTVEDWMLCMERDGVPTDRRRKAATLLRTVLKSAGQDRMIATNPAREVAKPRTAKQEIQFWTADQARTVVHAAHGRRLGSMFVLALDSGCRIGELQALHWPELDLDARTVRVLRTLDAETGEFVAPKTAKARRTIPLSPGTVAALLVHRTEMRAEGRDVTAGIVFPAQRSGGPVAYQDVWRRYFGGLVKAAGVPRIALHGTRHTCATLLLRAGLWVNVVSERLGHEDVETTLRLYAHVIEGDRGRRSRPSGRRCSGRRVRPVRTPRWSRDAIRD